MFDSVKFSIKQWAEDDRPREKLIAKGKHTLTDAELLAIILGSGSAELSAVELSKRVLSSVNHDLYLLGKLTLDDLKKFKGIGEAKAVAVLASLEIGRRRSETERKTQLKISGGKDVFEVIRNDIGDLKHEEFWMLCLRRNNTVISKHKISMGGVASTLVDLKIVFNIALRELATGIILCHNHPSGNTQPSEIDIQLTKQVLKAAAIFDIEVIDHVIITEHDYFSMKERNVI